MVWIGEYTPVANVSKISPVCPMSLDQGLIVENVEFERHAMSDTNPFQPRGGLAMS